MRIRIAAPALAGALALGAFAGPSAAFAATATPATAKPVIVSAVSPSVVLGLHGRITLGVTVTARDAAGIRSIKAAPYPLALAKQYGGAPTAADLASEPDGTLKVKSSTATTQTAGIVDSENITNSADLPPNLMAGTWAVAVLVTAKDGSTTFSAQATTFSWKRADALSSKVSTTRIRKGANLTVRGQLSRANWDKHVYQGNGAQWVRLEFRKTGSSTWSTVKWVKSSATGALSATVKDSTGGSWRYVYGGNTVSGAAASAQTWVGLK